MKEALYSASMIAKWFLAHNREVQAEGDAEFISNLKLQKLLYYAQGGFMALYDYPLFNDPIVAWKHGPVVESVYHKYKCNGSNGIEFDEEFDFDSIDSKANELLEEVYDIFGQYSAWKLRQMTHEERPWIVTEQSDVIENELIMNYFKEVYIDCGQA